MNEITTRMSYPERKVTEYLRHIGIDWTYEQPVFVWDDEGRPRVLEPDFYLHKIGIYVEVCGSRDFDYEFRKRIFSKNGCCVIFLHVFKGANRWQSYFMCALRNNLLVKWKHTQVYFKIYYFNSAKLDNLLKLLF
jgi:hypothetical protein